MQHLCFLKEGETSTLSLPDPDTEIMTGVRWGDPCALFTPAYWYTQYLMHDRSWIFARHRIGETFAEEVAACLLGGYGIPAEVGIAAFEQVKRKGMIEELCDNAVALEKTLSEPLDVRGRRVHYRFRRQKAHYLAAAFRHLRIGNLPFNDAVSLRNSLMAFSGIGPKTASWIVRNWMNSDAVAILDIHIYRAGLLMKLYSRDEQVGRHYLHMEKRFIALANELGVRTSELDALIWSMMRATPRLVSRLLKDTD